MFRKAITTFAAAAALAAPIAIAAPAQAVEVDGNPYDFDIVTAAIDATGADEVLATLDSYTAFFPNDRAFEVLAKEQGLLPAGYKYGATVDEEQIFNALVEGLGVETITEVLFYHVFPGAALEGADVVAGPRIKTLTMANGQNLKVYVLSKSRPVIVLGDKDGRFFNDFVVRSKINFINSEDAVVHGISDVLLPKL
jgi:uncharacterized surface protein with fasciclin (FAS1) repeats